MKKLFPRRRRTRKAFTLVELLIVIAIIAILAALLVPVTGRIGVSRMKSVSRAELNQISAAIESYKAKYGFYPPDNPTNVMFNPLYFELMGTVLTNDITKGANPAGDSFIFVTLDKRAWIFTNTLHLSVGVSGLANSSSNPRGTDERPAPVAFLKDVKPLQVGTKNGATNLLCSQEWTRPGGNSQNPWRYNSSNPTNNPGAYDLWVDLYIDGKTNRISNWSKQPQIVW